MEMIDDPIVQTRYELIVKNKALNEAIAATANLLPVDTINNIPIERSVNGYFVKGFSYQQAIVSFVDFLIENLPDNEIISFDVVLIEPPNSKPVTFQVSICEFGHSILSI